MAAVPPAPSAVPDDDKSNWVMPDVYEYNAARTEDVERCARSARHRSDLCADDVVSNVVPVLGTESIGFAGMMEQLIAINTAPTEAERERLYDVLTSMLAAGSVSAATQVGPASSEDLAGGNGTENGEDEESRRFAVHCAAQHSEEPEHCDALGSEPAVGGEAGRSLSAQRQALPAELFGEEAAKAAWVAEAEVEWAADVEEHARRRAEADAKAEAARVRQRAEAAATKARLEEELADVPDAMRDCVLKRYALDK